MTEERTPNVSSEESSQTRQRRKRKWDQPAESLVSAGVAPLVGGTVGPLGGAAVPGALLTNPLGAIPVPLIQQHANAIAQMLNLPKIQDELIIAREIVINDAESSVRFKLTKRQTQEEIQRCTGAVVITRGKYHPPNAPPDGEKPLYLHISAGAHLKDTTERILSVDRAASMVEEMLKQHAVSSALPALSNGTKGTHAHSACVFLGFDPDPLLNIAARICGPSDQYINHIMNETGVNVILRGRGSGKIGNPHVEGPEQLHLFLSSNDSRSLENAKCLAENLLDTISIECGVSRVSSSKVYGSVAPPQQVYSAVPPPHQLVAGVLNSGANTEASTSSAAGLTTSTLTVSPITPAFSQGTVSGQSPVNSVGHTRPLLSGGTSYSGYGGIYPQATPLQQVALVLRQSTSPASSVAAPTPLVPSNEPKLGVSSSSEEKRPPQKRKFQELPISSKSSAKSIQGSEFKRPADIPSELSVRNVSSMPVPKKFVAPTSNSMPPPPPPRTMVPPPPPPKFTSSSPVVKGQEKNNIVLGKVKSDVVSDTLVKLMEYGDDDDDPDENSNEAVGSSNSGSVAARKPFWAL